MNHNTSTRATLAPPTRIQGLSHKVNMISFGFNSSRQNMMALAELFDEAGVDQYETPKEYRELNEEIKTQWKDRLMSQLPGEVFTPEMEEAINVTIRRAENYAVLGPDAEVGYKISELIAQGRNVSKKVIREIMGSAYHPEPHSLLAAAPILAPAFEEAMINGYSDNEQVQAAYDVYRDAMDEINSDWIYDITN